MEKAELLDRLRMFEERPRGFKGGISAGKYIRITGTSRATATRDLQDLVEKDALIRRRELLHKSYSWRFRISAFAIPCRRCLKRALKSLRV